MSRRYWPGAICLANTEVLIWLSLRQDQVDDGDQCREEAQDQGEVVERAHQEERVAQRVDQVDQRLGAQVCASKRALQGLSWHGSCHGSQSTQRSRSSSFQATVLLGLDEGRRHHLPAQQQSCSAQAHAQHRSSSTASHCCQDGFATNSKLPYSQKACSQTTCIASIIIHQKYDTRTTCTKNYSQTFHSSESYQQCNISLGLNLGNDSGDHIPYKPHEVSQHIFRRSLRSASHSKPIKTHKKATKLST